ncbi:amino acid ABC transporter ATP-binding protein [Neorhizobium sp. BETTINA12A]|uniref:amino acid ABC transporter ATP-binding protein n=1 Tax=Neorhizobium sp. BETTINA12A TaxID=2908924 RepID=UPI001FF5CD78|nr:amino acid ABC transporter ATP-binding protein [Neorhizobium sp. BETTINA12A]MCJ9751430.1 amino acid ABC transporter ATP-binding protein [Neorhizobium sp. BETTINA12A]
MENSEERKTVISLRNASKWFPSRDLPNVRGLNSVSLDVLEGDVVVLLGPSGSGKSTLLRCLNLLNIPDEGQLRVGSVEWDAKAYFSARSRERRYSRDFQRLRRETGMVFQHYNLFPHMTVLENVMCGLVHSKGMSKDEAREIAREEIVKVGLADREGHYPGQLSGGQKQRVAIARAIATKPLAMLFDEPTSALDPELRGSVLAVMQDLAKEGMTMVVVTHEMGFARAVGNHIVFLESGEIIEEGLSNDFLDNPKTERAQRFLSEIA